LRRPYSLDEVIGFTVAEKLCLLKGTAFSVCVKNPVPPGRARLQPRRKLTLPYPALAAEVRFFDPRNTLMR
jgi:hypothetical protein